MLKNLTTCLLRHFNDKALWLSFFSGFFLVFAYAPFEHWYLPFILLPVWLTTLLRSDKQQISKYGYYFALGWFVSGIHWVHVSIVKFGGMPLFFSLLLMFLLCLYLAIFPALACWLTQKFSKNKQPNLWLLPCFWLLTEYLRGVVLTGFPWLSLGYSQINSPLRELAPIIGEIGITFVVLVISVAIAYLVAQKQLKTASLVLFISSLSIPISSQFTWVKTTGKTIKTALVQGNIAQHLKWQPEQELPTMLLYADLTRANNADIFVWPESAIPSVEANVQDYLIVLDSAAANNQKAIITGIIDYKFQSREFYNSLIVLGKKESEDLTGSYNYEHENRYSKNHLLPIGEFVPFQEWLRPIAPLFNLPLSSFSRGNYVQTNLIANGVHILPVICFEIAFPEQLAANFTTDTQVILTVSNDAWFGTSIGPFQHMEIARMRALEFARPLLRATNTGITAVVDHQGSFVNKLPQFEQGVLLSDIALVEGNTPFSQYGRTPLYVFVLVLCCFILWREQKNHATQAN